MQHPRRSRSSAVEAVDQLLYKPEEAAEITALSRDWLITHARKGLIPHRRFGKKLYRFAHEDLEAIKAMAARPVEPTSRRDRRSA